MHRGVGRVKGSRSGQLGTDYQRVYSLRHGIYVLNKFNSIETRVLLYSAPCCAVLRRGNAAMQGIWVCDRMMTTRSPSKDKN
jgi:hypothetical protein